MPNKTKLNAELMCHFVGILLKMISASNRTPKSEGKGKMYRVMKQDEKPTGPTFLKMRVCLFFRLICF